MVRSRGFESRSTRASVLQGVTEVFHYAPLHYLLFIARSEALLSKTGLLRMGYSPTHFRRTSQRQDQQRGFADYVHLTLRESPPILRAKLDRGFPHFEFRIPVQHLERQTIHLCRYNIARSRYLRRPGKAGPPEDARNGRYHGGKQLPTAETAPECAALLAANKSGTIEVLVPHKLGLPEDTRLVFFSPDDLKLARTLLRSIRRGWQCELSATKYSPNPHHSAEARLFLTRAFAEPSWRGDGLDFDTLRK